MMNKISIIIPVYNSEEYLSRCIESVLSQDYVNLEIILVNDGSTDGSAKICEQYSKTDNRIVYISQKNGGSACARNTGVAKATGDYITFVDSDDYIDESHISSLAKNASSSSIVHTGLASDSGRQMPYIEIKADVSINEWYKLMMLEKIHVGTVSKLIPAKIAKNCEFPSGIKVGEDATYYFYMVNNYTGKDITVHIDTFLPKYHYTDNNKSATNTNNGIADWKNNLDVFRRMIRMSNPDIRDYSICGFCLTCMGIMINNYKSGGYDRRFNKGLKKELCRYKDAVFKYMNRSQKIKYFALTRLNYLVAIRYCLYRKFCAR